ncbi:DoxX family protein [Pseudomonas sp. RIT-To-2]|uniref:DoxX family protein n=1 Tax=Pseudomonas sp. RIT-To-2 TaxID=3462541 RepID=UPI002412F67C
MNPVERMSAYAPDLAMLWMRVCGAVLLIAVHGLPKLVHFDHELQVIEDPFEMGAQLTLSLAIFAEVICPIGIILGLFTRLATLPVLFLLAVSVLYVHPEWSLEQGQFAWLLLIIFSTILIGGAGRFGIAHLAANRWPVLDTL